MKKLLIGILVPVTIIVGGAATLYFLVSDFGNPTYQKTSLSLEDITNQNLAKSFLNTKDTGKITYEMTQDDFNQILSLSMESMDDKAKDYLRAMEIRIDKDTYHILVYAKAGIISSTIDVSCSFSSDEEKYYLNIQNVKVGHLSGLTSIAMAALRQANLDGLFSSIGVRMKEDFDNKRFVYSKKDAGEDLSSLLSSQSEDPLVSSLLGNIQDDDLLSLDFTDKMTAEMNLEPLHFNSSFCSTKNMLQEEDMALEEKKDKVKRLLEENVIDMKDDHPQIAFSYLVKGYDGLSKEEKSYIDSISFASVDISDLAKKSYRGYQPSKADIQKTVLDAALDGSLVKSDGILIREDVLNDYLQSQGLLGYGYLMSYHAEGEYILNYITLDNCYFNLLDRNGKEEMDMVLGISINGYETSLVFENKKSESLSYGMKLKNENVYFGNRSVDDELKQQLYVLIQNNLPSNDFMTFDGKGTFTINFEGCLKTYLDTLSLIGKKLTLSSSIEGSSLDDAAAGVRLQGNI